MISPTRIAEITALAEAATPGEWITLPTNCGTGAVGAGPFTYRAHWEGTAKQAEMDANAAFIAAARTAVPELLADRIAALRAENEALREAILWAETSDPQVAIAIRDKARALLGSKP